MVGDMVLHRSTALSLVKGPPGLRRRLRVLACVVASLAACSPAIGGSDGGVAGGAGGGAMGGGFAGGSTAGGSTAGGSTAGGSTAGGSTGGGSTAGGSTGGGSAPDCARPEVRCVPSEYATIQAAADVTLPGDLVFVAAGTWRGVNVTRSGTKAARVEYRGAAGARITQGSQTNDDGVRLQNVSDIVVQGFEIDSTMMTGRCVAARGAAATAPMRRNVVRNVTCTNAAHEGFYLSQFADGLVEGCTITGSGRDGTARGHGLYLANGGSDGTTLRGNRISGAGPMESAGIHLNGDLSVGGDGLIQDVVIENNVISGNNHNGVNADGVQRAIVRGNVITGNARSGVRAYRIDGAAGPIGWRLVNNTISGNGAWAVKFTEDAAGHVLFNNLLFSTTGSLCVGGAVQSDSNRFDGPLSRDEEATTITLTAWRTATGQDPASSTSTATANFVGAMDVHLLMTAPARNAGVASFATVNAPTTDLAGVSRPRGGAIDLGAYEFVE
jgi:hypothetical protein